jgi:hypothetical protein
LKGGLKKLWLLNKLHRFRWKGEAFLESAMATSTTTWELTNTLALIAQFSRMNFTCRDAMVKSVPHAVVNCLVVIARSMKATKMHD